MGGRGPRTEERVGAVDVSGLGAAWRDRFLGTVASEPFARDLKAASLEARLKDWTASLAQAVVATGEAHGWKVAAKGHLLARMPQPQEEYLGIDAMAFEDDRSQWLFPVAVLELENSSKDQRVAYSLWKLLNLRARLRVLFCYRPSVEGGTALVRHMERSVVHSMTIPDRVGLGGETLAVVGYRSKADTFPDGFFRWWSLESNTGEFELF